MEPAVHPSVATFDQSLINTVNSSSLNTVNMSRASSQSVDRLASYNQPGDSIRKQSNCSVTSGEDTSNNNNSRSKGRKRWGLNIGVKSGSVKSNKSEKSDGDSRHSSGRSKGVGGMLANISQGLTRSRPDLLSDNSYIADQAFTLPNKIPRESLGQYLETKLTEGEVVKEFEKISKRKVECNISVASLEENIPRNRYNKYLLLQLWYPLTDVFIDLKMLCHMMKTGSESPMTKTTNMVMSMLATYQLQWATVRGSTLQLRVH